MRALILLATFGLLAGCVGESETVTPAPGTEKKSTESAGTVSVPADAETVSLSITGMT